MAKNIDFMGAIFPDVPSVRLPQQGGGLVSFDDTTDANATAADIAQGKTAYVNGEKLTGTASGGGGSSKIVTGTFTAPSTQGISSVSIPYTGSGYPILFIINVQDDNWSDLIRRYAVGLFTAVNLKPELSTNHEGRVALMYKNSTSSATSYSGGGSNLVSNAFGTSDAGTSSTNCIRIKNGTTFSFNVVEVGKQTSYYGLMAGYEYSYIVFYSS